MKPEYPDQILKDHPDGDNCPTYYDGCNCTVQTLQRAYELLNAATKVADASLKLVKSGYDGPMIGNEIEELYAATIEYERIANYKQGMFSPENLAKFNIPE